MRRAFAATICAMALAGCETATLSGTVPAPPPAVAMPAAGGSEPLLGTLLSSGAAGLFTDAGRNGDVTRWRARDGSGFDLRRGLVIATYAIGDDLASADADEALARIAAGQPGPSTRVHRYIDGENQSVIRAFRCHVEISAPRPSAAGSVRDALEFCRGADTEFTNRYLVDAGGKVLSSTQWIGPGAGYLRIAPARSGAAAIVPLAVRN